MKQPIDLERERWIKVRALFDDLVELAPAERQVALARSILPRELLDEARALLAAADSAGDFLERGGATGLTGGVAATPGYQSLASGARVGAFRVEALIGRGGQGEVYRAARADGQFEQVVALKLLRPEAADHVERFRTERQILAGLEHPAIARLIDGGTAPDGRPYLAMEFVDGAPITTYCAAGRLGLKARLRLFQTVCAAVAYAHRNLIVHRDLKPGNVLVTPEGQVKLLDFGVAHILAETGNEALTQAILTPDYAAPEQFEGRRPTTATDIYALGGILFELLTGRSPWRLRDTPFAGALRIMQDAPPQPSKVMARQEAPPVPGEQVRGDLDVIIQKAMRYEPEARYESVAALSEDIERHLVFLPVAARAGDFGYRARRFLRRNRGRLLAATAVMVVLAGGVGGVLWQAGKARAARQSAIIESERASAVRDYVMLLLRTASSAGGPSFATAKQVLDATAAQLGREANGGSVTLLGTLGELYAELDDFNAAAPLLERYIAIAERNGDGWALANARQTLAAVSVRRGQLDQAAALLGQAKAFWAGDAGAYAREQAEAAGIEAGLLRERSQRDEAIALLRGAISRLSALLGEGGDGIATLHHNLGVHLLEAGRRDEAEASLKTAQHLLEQQGRTRSATGIGVMNNRAAIAFQRGDVAAAEGMWREVIALRRELYGPSIALAALQLNLGRLLLTTGRAEEALPVLEEALAIGTAFAGETSPVTIMLRQSRGLGLLVRDRDGEAAVEIDKALAASAQAFGAQHIYYGMALSVRAQLYLRAADWTRARADIDASEAILDRAGPAGAVHLVEVRKLREILEQNAK
ncbi:serine/threonine-protein kinase [Bosea caraganae]|nr:serine/threonine-protein kinase [Bosea caraganae]